MPWKLNECCSLVGRKGTYTVLPTQVWLWILNWMSIILLLLGSVLTTVSSCIKCIFPSISILPGISFGQCFSPLQSPENPVNRVFFFYFKSCFWVLRSGSSIFRPIFWFFTVFVPRNWICEQFSAHFGTDHPLNWTQKWGFCTF